MHLSSSHRTHSKLLISRYSSCAKEHVTVDPTSIPHATGTAISATQIVRAVRLLLFLVFIIRSRSRTAQHATKYISISQISGGYVRHPIPLGNLNCGSPCSLHPTTLYRGGSFFGLRMAEAQEDGSRKGWGWLRQVRGGMLRDVWSRFRKGMPRAGDSFDRTIEQSRETKPPKHVWLFGGYK